MSRKLTNYTAVQMGKMGGKKLKDTMPDDYFSKIAKKSHENRDPEFYKNLAASGLAARKKKEEAKKKANRTGAEKLVDILTGQG